MGAGSFQAFTLEAHAKVNLSLAITYPPKDGYHSVRTVMQELDLHDDLHFSIKEDINAQSLRTAAGTYVELNCELAGLSAQDNLIFRAINTAEITCGIPIASTGTMLCIDVNKRIPAGGGLGGGSSDAAGALKAYARIVGMSPTSPQIIEVARKLGADIPFFLYGQAALMGGRGDIFEQYLPSLQAPIVLMGDAQGMSTAQVYKLFDENPVLAPDVDALVQAMQAKPYNLVQIASLCANNLGVTACEASPKMRQRIKKSLEYPGVLNALVSGSGATSFAICEDMQSAENLAKNIISLCDWVYLCHIPPFASCESVNS